MSFDSQAKDSKKGGVLESASKRVRMIFSVMASPNRIDILRILNTKGPLTYSELKALAGFKSKKESGKFAYHLRKLLRQLLVALNKAERRYTITNLGKLVLSLARQIEERSIIESGKMYVRTSRHTIEEFNSHKIIQSLVREANLPLEQAHKITEEVENKIYKFQTAYLTSSLIRETVNSVLIEHGHEEYRNKLARVGLPSSDIVEMLSAEGATVDSVMAKTAGSVFSEYLVFNTLPKDIADMHLAGEINISNAGVWGLLPDTVFFDLSELEEGLDLKGRFLNVARIPAIKSPDDVIAALPALVSLLSREASSEVVIEGIVPALLKNLKDPEDIASRFARALAASSAAPSYSGTIATIAVPDGIDARQLNALLDGYRKYVDATPAPRIGLAIAAGKIIIKDNLDHVAAAVRSGGIISIGSSSGGARASNGIRKSGKGAAAMSFHSLSINLPRLAYESNKDETYFRAKLALMIKPSLAAMSMRKKTIVDYAKRGLLPSLASATQSMQRGTSTIVINLTGARESVYNILGESSSSEVLQKVLKTATEVAASQGKQLGEEGAGIAMVSDGSGVRFATLDSEKYGKVSLLQSQNTTSYSQGMTLNGKEILSDKGATQECIAIDKLLNGGFAATLDVTDLSAAEAKSAIEVAVAAELPFLRPRIKLAVCTTCGQRSKAVADKCEHCKSPHKLTMYS
ncbi:putative anaerobic ribonucleoside-triphosphate reductase [Candidatus Nitrososphaera gargensis Ga9.2]|uniref:Putative anaerobic ribonucleoside-triphosphate reductase n=1 Tax=Nitrososphaera gargensis (strain Ga9.2) TaxID=1237085 RepID=K0ILA7_NITGG|nr:anaerobic ribonucleoside-triphosphate reductase [Candidatus Nitrososphaera gargensis]AFU56974.1 putative anaerobic ribonucleoside-triphosphate reductase [Candidatus Nitrososphaera gargensis Ga9.2]